MAGTRNSYTLHGRSLALDERVNAVRGDLADVALAGTLFAPHYAEARLTHCTAPHAALRCKPDGDQTSELLQGEGFMLLDISGGWAWGYCAHDHYVGYVEAAALGEAAAREETSTPDAVTAALTFLDMPYLLGGRGGAGIDCSGLIQRSLAAIGIAAPRDSDMQQAELGRSIETPERGDLIGFAGHIGMMEDGETLIHATAHWGKVVRGRRSLRANGYDHRSLHRRRARDDRPRNPRPVGGPRRPPDRRAR